METMQKKADWRQLEAFKCATREKTEDMAAALKVTQSILTIKGLLTFVVNM